MPGRHSLRCRNLRKCALEDLDFMQPCGRLSVHLLREVRVRRLLGQKSKNPLRIVLQKAGYRARIEGWHCGSQANKKHASGSWAGREAYPTKISSFVTLA